ncbi:MAG: SUMF1/EgtB/PvdO family nonheme iron enzyme [Labilithrix sp.]|nr:SUMF1/EgtB/PvdO family nonheme iron enzyme [Labilithrix sp.]
MISPDVDRAPRVRWLAVLATIVAANVSCSSCRRDAKDDASDATSASPSAASDATVSSWPAAAVVPDSGPPRPGMAWIPAGTLRAGTPPARSPRVADEEMPGADVAMGGFYIDLLPWPNEPNAIPTSNVTRDEAEHQCASKGKRLCTELEWERACKGPANTTYEYGDAYRKEVCGTGIALEQASRRPTGEHAQCKSGFGVAEMHGGVWEWTSSAWGRGSRDAAQGVLRGGNSLAGELVGRCANAIARAPSKKAPTMGFRCCAGPKSDAEVALELRGTPGLAVASAATARLWASAIAAAATAPAGATAPVGASAPAGAASPVGAASPAGATALDAPEAAKAIASDGADALDPKSLHAWTWIPVANEELAVAMGCTTEAPKRCAVVVARPGGDAGPGEVLATVATGKELSEVARVGDARHLRMRSLDPRGVYSREITYVYGRVDLGDAKRP